MPRKGENIYKRKDGRWEGRYIKTHSAEGKAIYGYAYARTYRDVKQKLTFCRQESAQNSTSRMESLSSAEIKFGVLADTWLSSVRPQIKESTYNKYRNLLDCYILPVYRELDTAKMTQMQLETFASDLLTTGGKNSAGLSAKTVADVFSVLKSIIQYSSNHGITFPCNGSGINIRRKEKDLRVLSQTEQNQLLCYLTENLNNRNFGILLCMFTGLRVGEICALKWEDISIRERSLQVHSTLQRIQCKNGEEPKTKITITTPKSKCSIRIIPLPEIILSVIKANFSGQHGYLLTGEEYHFIEPRTMQNHFKRVLRQSCIEPVNFHTLRHTFATRCVEVGFDVKSLSEILGHSSVSITMNRYVHPSMELKRENMERLSGSFVTK